MVKEITLSEAQRLEHAADTAEETFQMDEQSFRAFYDRTARPLWCYLRRVSGDPALADDLLQESYYRLLRSRHPEMSQVYLKNYLFRIATNLLRDHWRRGNSLQLVVSDGVPRTEEAQIPAGERTAERIQLQSDLSGALRNLKPRERELLWLAYVEGSSHKEIAEIVGLKAESIRLLLFRARQKFAALLRKRGFSGGCPTTVKS